MAIKSFADETTADIYNGINSKAARRIPNRVWSAAQRKLTAIHEAKKTLDLNAPGMRFESLKYDRPGFYSIRVNDQFRIVFGFENGDAHHVGIEDFHGRKQT